MELRHRDARLCLLGTKHTDPWSCNLVKYALDHLPLDTTALELDVERMGLLRAHAEANPNRRCEFAVADRHPRKGKVELIDTDTGAFAAMHTAIERGSPWPELVASNMAYGLHGAFRHVSGFNLPDRKASMYEQGITQQRDDHMAARLAPLLRRDVGCAVAVVGKDHVPGLVQRLVVGSSEGASEQEREAQLASARRARLDDRMPQRRALTDTEPILEGIARHCVHSVLQASPCARTGAFFEAVHAEIGSQLLRREQRMGALPWLSALLHPDACTVLAAELCAALDRGDDPVQSCRAAVRLALEGRGFAPIELPGRLELANPFRWSEQAAQVQEHRVMAVALATDEIRRRESALAALSEHARRAGIEVTNRVLRFDDFLRVSRSVALSDHTALRAPELDLGPLVASVT